MFELHSLYILYHKGIFKVISNTISKIGFKNFSQVNYFVYIIHVFAPFERIRKRILRFGKTRGMEHVRLSYRLILNLSVSSFDLRVEFTDEMR